MTFYTYFPKKNIEFTPSWAFSGLLGRAHTENANPTGGPHPSRLLLVSSSPVELVVNFGGKAHPGDRSGGDCRWPCRLVEGTWRRSSGLRLIFTSFLVPRQGDEVFFRVLSFVFTI